MLEFIIGEAVWYCFLFLLFIAIYHYLAKYPLKKTIGFGLLFVIVLTGVSYIMTYLPFHIAIIALGITIFLFMTIIYRYLDKKSLKESITTSLALAIVLPITVLIFAKLIDFLGI